MDVVPLVVSAGGERGDVRLPRSWSFVLSTVFAER